VAAWWARPQNRISAVIGGLLSTRMVTLEVTGRRSGQLISFPLAVADYDGERYLVAMLGQNAELGEGPACRRWPGRAS
jgi:hypothetical protein